ncbi:MAG: methyltransferase [Clostridia bacterium]|nr:methyltransferase [Clostridia bacterium]
MTSRERVLSAIAHREPDRVPLDIGSTPSSGISAIAYNNLKKHLGITEGHTRIYDVVQQVAEPEETILDRFGADVIDIGRAFNDKDSDWYDVTLADGSARQYPAWFQPEKQADGSWIAKDGEGAIARMPVGATFFDQAVFPYLDDYPDSWDGLDHAMGRVLWSALVHSPWDHAGEDRFYETLREKALMLRKTTDRALMIVCGCNLFEWGTFLRRIDNFLMDIMTDEENVEALLDQLMIRHLATLEKVCASVGDVVDILRFGDDLGMNAGLFMPPEKYRKLFKPRHAKLNDYVHRHSGMKTLLHSCGSLYPILPDLIEAGYDILNPVQTSARQMDPEVLKREFGRDITFWGGGCNTRSVLNHASPAEVYDHCRRRIEIFSKDGGFVFNQEHNILPDVPPENILAMYRAVADSQKG